MSLINDMLRDLDQRKASAPGADVLLPRVARPEPATGIGRKAVIAVFVAVVAALTVIALWRVGFMPEELQADIAAEQSVALAPSPLAGEGSAEGERPQASPAQMDKVAETALVEPVQAAQEEAVRATVAQKVDATPVDMASTHAVHHPQTEEPVQISEAMAAEPVREAAIETVPPVQVAAAAEPVVIKDESEVQSPDSPRPGDRELTVESVAKPGVMAKTPVLTTEQRDRQAATNARQLWQAGQALEAENLLRRHLAETPESPASRALLSQWLMSSGRDREAAVLLRDVSATSSPELKMIKARLLQAQGQLQAAVDLLETRAPALQDDVAYHVLLAALYSQAGQFEDAVNAYAGLVALNSAKADWWAGLGIALEGDGKLDPARRAYQQAASLHGLHPQLQSHVNGRLQALQR